MVTTYTERGWGDYSKPSWPRVFFNVVGYKKSNLKKIRDKNICNHSTAGVKFLAFWWTLVLM